MLSVSSGGWIFWVCFDLVSAEPPAPRHTQPCVNLPKTPIEYRHLVFLQVIYYKVTLFQQGAYYSHQITTRLPPPNFQTFLRPWEWFTFKEFRRKTWPFFLLLLWMGACHFLTGKSFLTWLISVQIFLWHLHVFTQFLCSAQLQTASWFFCLVCLLVFFSNFNNPVIIRQHRHRQLSGSRQAVVWPAFIYFGKAIEIFEKIFSKLLQVS